MKNALLIVTIAAALTACGNDTPQYVQQQPAPSAQAPVVVQQGGSDVGDMLAAGAVGMIAGQALANRTQPAPYHAGYSQSYNSRPVVKNKTVIVQKNVVVQKKVVINKSPSRSSFSRGSRRK